MKIYINREHVSGPWGGGVKPLGRLIEVLNEKGHETFFGNITQNDYDVCFCWDPRPNNLGIWYGTLQHYCNLFGSKLIQRVGDVGTHGKPDLTSLVAETVKFSNKVIFTSNWAQNYIVSRNDDKNYNLDNFHVIENSPLEIFFKHRNKNTNINSKPKVVTHHWSNNQKKGFDLYRALDESIHTGKLDIDFTYIGRVPADFSFKASKIVEPQDQESLCRILPQHDIYLTASQEEAGANHILEAMAAGLPVLYQKDGGSIPEYCKEYSDFQYDNILDLRDQLTRCVKYYQNAKNSVLKFSRSIDDTILRYVDIIEQL